MRAMRGSTANVEWLGDFRHHGGAVLLTDVEGFRLWGGSATSAVPSMEVSYFGPLVAQLPREMTPDGPDEWHQRLEARSEESMASHLDALERAAMALGTFAIERGAPGAARAFQVLDAGKALFSITVRASSARPGSPEVELSATGAGASSLPAKVRRWLGDGRPAVLPCLEAAAEVLDEVRSHFANTPHLAVCERTGTFGLAKLFERAGRRGGEPIGDAVFAADWIHGRDSLLTVSVSKASDASRSSALAHREGAALVDLADGHRGVVWSALATDDDGYVSVATIQTETGSALVLATIGADDDDALALARDAVFEASGTLIGDLRLEGPAVCIGVNESVTGSARLACSLPPRRRS